MVHGQCRAADFILKPYNTDNHVRYFSLPLAPPTGQTALLHEKVHLARPASQQVQTYLRNKSLLRIYRLLCDDHARVAADSRT